MSDGRSGERARLLEGEPVTLEQMRIELLDLKRKHEHLARVVYGDPSAELGRQRGLAEQIVEIHTAVMEIRDRLRAKLPDGVSG